MARDGRRALATQQERRDSVALMRSGRLGSTERGLMRPGAERGKGQLVPSAQAGCAPERLVNLVDPLHGLALGRLKHRKTFLESELELDSKLLDEPNSLGCEGFRQIGQAGFVETAVIRGRVREPALRRPGTQRKSICFEPGCFRELARVGLQNMSGGATGSCATYPLRIRRQPAPQSRSKGGLSPMTPGSRLHGRRSEGRYLQL